MVESITKWGCRTAAGMWTVLRVFDERAKVGYEVAIRGLDKKRVETSCVIG